MQYFMRCILVAFIGLILSFALGFEAQAAIGFEAKINTLNRNLVSKVLPLVATCGLLYGGFLMATGNAEGRSKIIAVLGGSIIALLAPSLMKFLAGAL